MNVAPGTDATRLTGKEPNVTRRTRIGRAWSCSRWPSRYRAVPPPRRQEAEAHGGGAHGRRAAEGAHEPQPQVRQEQVGDARSALRRSSHPTKNRVRTVTTYCSGGTRTVFYIKRVTITKIVPGPGTVITAPPAPRRRAEGLPAHAAAQQRRRVQVRRRRLDRQLRRRHPLQDRARRLRGEADDYTNADVRAGREDKGTVVVSSGDNFLAGLNLRASFQRFDAGNGRTRSTTRSRSARIGYDAVTIGNHEYDFGPDAARAADRLAGAGGRAVPVRQHRLQRLSRRCRRCATRAASPTRSIVTKGGQQIGIIGVTTPDGAEHLLAGRA